MGKERWLKRVVENPKLHNGLNHLGTNAADINVETHNSYTSLVSIMYGAKNVKEPQKQT